MLTISRERILKLQQYAEHKDAGAVAYREWVFKQFGDWNCCAVGEASKLFHEELWYRQLMRVQPEDWIPFSSDGMTWAPLPHTAIEQLGYQIFREISANKFIEAEQTLDKIEDVLLEAKRKEL